MSENQESSVSSKFVISCTSHEFCDNSLRPLSENASSIDLGEEKARIDWDRIKARPGAVETSFELIGVLVLTGSAMLSIGTKVMASWIYDRFFKNSEPTKLTNRVSLTIEKPDGTRILLDATSEEKIRLDLDKHLNVSSD